MFIKIVQTLLPVIAVIVGWFVISTVKKMPDMLAEKLRDEREFSFKQALQIDSYYRQDGVLQDILMKWAKYAMDTDFVTNSMNTDRGKQRLNELLQKTVGYGSPKTIKLLSYMFQEIYTDNEEKRIENNLPEGMTTLVVLAMVVSSLKKDFTGQDIDPLDIMKIKINDFYAYEKEFKKEMIRIGKAVDE